MVNQSKCKMALSKIDTIDTEMEQVNQEKYLRQATQYYCALEKPLKYGPVIETLPDLITALHREFESNYVNIEMVNHIMLSYKSNPKEWRKYAKFDRYTYTRNLVDAGNGKFNLLILCWGEGHSSSVHDHADSHCFMKMLKGDLREKRYRYPNRPGAIEREQPQDHHAEIDDNELVEIGETPIPLNDVAYINDNLGLHRVENPSHSDTSVSLHLYCPPFDTCSVFQDNCKKTTAKVTFWSKYGVRTKLDEQ
ncbi:cysteine dioxygenase type 1 isoform X1 [Drosophila nasuta]|uniref:Cysteine dioxygenase n=2 Tax=Drosophila albomicans TaxID=7291 RepID=A0A9C6W656_DROAB|nr:cysteine dioxygenase type 1 isoform X1 [Drosophila albomicans]XP_060657950.1 cysteine dioxygenase type 1 isoform X1 [Drosophila nasuta]